MAICFAAWAMVDSAMACTNFLVGKAASASGNTIISYAADSYSLYGALHFRPAADHAAGEMRSIYDWDSGKYLGEIPEVAHTYSVVGNTNEHQVTIGETTWGGQEQCWDTAGIDYGSLIYIALERSATAREAIDCMTSLVEKYGYASEGESFSIGDPNEIWIMDMIGGGPGSGKVAWVATRVPDDCIAAHANQCRTTTINFKDKKHKEQLWSKNVVQMARDMKLYEGKDADFNFQAVYNPYDFSGLYVCEARVWSFFRHFSQDMDRYYDFATGKTYVETKGADCGERMPLYIRPNHLVSVQEIKDCMRDEYQGTPLDITSADKLASGPYQSKLRHGSLRYVLDSVTYWYERPIATQQTAWSFVSEMRADNPAGGVFWFAVDDAACSVYVPLYSQMTEVPECFRMGNGDLYNYSPTSAWWAFNMVANWAYTKYALMKEDIRIQQNAWDERFNAQVAALDKEVAHLTKEDRRAMLTRYSVSQAEALTQAWKDLFIYLHVKYIDGQIRKEENGEFLRNAYGEPAGPNRPALPDAYLRMIAPQTARDI